jgi:hypothetical protein
MKYSGRAGLTFGYSAKDKFLISSSVKFPPKIFFNLYCWKKKLDVFV